MSNFSLDIRWWIFGIIITFGQIFMSDCAVYKRKDGVYPPYENDDQVVDSVTTTHDRTIDCPMQCSCLGDLADCSKNDLAEIPNIPSWAKKL